MEDKSIVNWETTLKAKLHGAHTTVIGERQGKKVLGIISQHEEVKSIIPSVITVKGKSSPGGNLTAKVLRPDERGNLRMLLSHGTSSQEIRIVTTVATHDEGERVMEELNALLFDI
ncbi:DUF2103 domain-containing protein [Methanococcoides sp. FTZ1]|uniref:DUF2103 domain-containing protein n=1 Tax=Methanococcoides sp. FTZ1 TaxID=3439061 RepID=UPI003F826E85